MANTFRDWIPDSVDEPKNQFADFVPDVKPQVKQEIKEEAPLIYKCNVCGLEAKSKLGLISHSRKHTTN